MPRMKLRKGVVATTARVDENVAALGEAVAHQLGLTNKAFTEYAILLAVHTHATGLDSPLTPAPTYRRYDRHRFVADPRWLWERVRDGKVSSALAIIAGQIVKLHPAPDTQAFRRVQRSRVRRGKALLHTFDPTDPRTYYCRSFAQDYGE